jgi:hypothetical protein
MMQGKTLIDIGEPAGMPPSAFYGMELQETSGYAGYVFHPQP